MDEQLKTNLTSSKLWVRLVYMLLLAFFIYLASIVITILVVVQFVLALITGNNNLSLRGFGKKLSTYIHQGLMFLTFNSEFKPFPFADWPDDEDDNKNTDFVTEKSFQEDFSGQEKAQEKQSEEPQEDSEAEPTGELKDADVVEVEPEVPPKNNNTDT